MNTRFNSQTLEDRNMLRLHCLVIGVLFTLASLPVLSSAADVELEERITIDNVTILPGEHDEGEKPQRYYYLPTDIRLTKDAKGVAGLFLIKYNLPTDESYSVADTDGTRKMAKQGGILCLEASYDLSEVERKQIENKLRGQEKNPNATLAMLPLDKGQLTMSYVDPGKGLVQIGPEPAPLDGNTVSWVIPLSRSATDIMYDVFKNPGRLQPVQMSMVFDYTGYTSPLKVTVTGNWDNVYNHTSWDLKAKGGSWFFNAKADIQDVVDKMEQDGTIKVKWKGPKDAEDVEKLVDRLSDTLIKAVFNTEHFKIEEPAKAEEAKSSRWGWLGLRGGVSFSRKSVERRRTGVFLFDFERKEKVTQTNRRFSNLKDIKLAETNVREVAAGDWGLVAPRIFVNADMAKYQKVVVRVKYPDSPPASAVFSQETGQNNQVPLTRQPNKDLPMEKRFEYEYSIQAQLKDGLFSKDEIAIQQFSTEVRKSDEPFLLLSSEDWNGPEPVKLQVRVLQSLLSKKGVAAIITVKWNDISQYSHQFALTPEKQDDLIETWLQFDKGKRGYTATYEWFEEDGTSHGPFEVTRATPEQILIPVLKD